LSILEVGKTISLVGWCGLRRDARRVVASLTRSRPRKTPPLQAVWKREAPAIRGLFFVGSGETGPKTRCANQIDCSQDVVGEYAEGGFGFDLIETSGEEAPACCHSFDSSKWVLGGASPPPHEARISLDARIHAL
jgi:hypothetical protein